MKIPVLMLLALTAFALTTAGCITDLHPIPNVQSGTDTGQLVEVSLLSAKGDYSLGRGCSWTVQYQVLNKGTAPARNVRLEVELVNDETSAVRDSKTVFAGTLGPGDVKTVTLDLDGECGKDYGVRVIPVFD
jgi:uncharacterized membrane protein